uniref:CSON007489 protein n=1 Tax=Culicoides sonorensis TaxID=179676 RepID=A0A336KER2_CULSO
MDELPTVYCLGQNRFGQFKTLVKEHGMFDKINWSEFVEPPQNTLHFDINVTVNYSAIALDFKLLIATIDLDDEVLTNQRSFITKSFTFDNLISKITSNTSYCLILLENGDLFQIMINNFVKRQIKCMNIETLPVKKSIFVHNNSSQIENEKIIDIACGETVCIAITNFNKVYNIPNLTYKFEKYVKIRKICCGSEHSMILTGNGDVYTWGTGLRGQLGHIEIKNEEEPKLVEGLSGIKIIDICGGGWCSAAVSAFGDLYVWGWNSCGQIGLKTYEMNSIQNPGLKRKAQTVYTAPTLVDFEGKTENEGISTEITVKKVFCGSKHMIVKTEDGRIFVTGSNKYNQLGLKEENGVVYQTNNTNDNFIDQFTEIKPKIHMKISDFRIYCAYSCTLFIENK